MSSVPMTTETIDMLQSSEIGQLKHVIWGAITPFEFTIDKDGLQEEDCWLCRKDFKVANKSVSLVLL